MSQTIHPASPEERLGVAPGATPAQIKAAYHAKLREFPAHAYPEEFKAIRVAYETLRQGNTAQPDDLFKVLPVQASLDPEALSQLRARAMAQVAVGLDDLIRATF